MSKNQAKDTQPNTTFESLGLKQDVLNGIRHASFTNPSPVQEKSIPCILEGKDLIAQAQTGTGKTAAFALPILNLLEFNDEIEALVITPTRELAIQISDEVFKLGKFLKAKTICVYGGQSIKKQIELMDKRPNVMIATPGRLLDHLMNNRLKHFNPKIVVLDEGDEMLDMGFIDDIEKIFEYLPNDCQTLLFSATMPPQIKNLAQKILCDPVHIKIYNESTTNVDISQRYYIINENERNQALIRLIDSESPTKSIIFIRTKKEADEVNMFLQASGYKSVALHGDMDQRSRRDAIMSFKNNTNDILVATDVAARGLDISDISHVFNYHIPLNTESYVHRIGRTGRAGKKGIALTLATPLEYKELKRIKQETNSKLELYEVPSIDNNKLISNILQTKVRDMAIDFYDNIKDKIDNAQLILKLLSIYLEKNKKIGLTKKEIEEHNAKSSQRYKDDKNKRFKDRNSNFRDKNSNFKDKNHRKNRFEDDKFSKKYDDKPRFKQDKKFTQKKDNKNFKKNFKNP